MKPKPLIGLTTTRIRNPYGNPAFSVNEPYQQSITAAGGLPVLLPLDLSETDIEALLLRLDGILFTGGEDIDPRWYGKPPHPRVGRIDASRDRVELHLFHKTLEAGKPFLGICRGFQLVNVALGGSLYEDLKEQYPGALQHDNHEQFRNHLAHQVDIEPGTHLDQVLSSSSLRVNSLHHQGVRQLAPGVRSAAYSPDGLVESLELPSHPFGLAVQWHPEELQEHEPQRKLFEALIKACQTETVNPMTR